MIFGNISLSILLHAMAYAGANKSALGLDASRIDLSARSNRVGTDNRPTFPSEEPIDAVVDAAVKATGLRGSAKGVDTNVSTEIEIGSNNDDGAGIRSNSADGTAPATKAERSNRLIGALTRTHVGFDVGDGEGGDDKNSIGEVGRRVLQGDCSTVASWHPQYSAGWDGGYCAFETSCNSRGYASELACCKSAYAGQTSGYCLSELEAPPTTSPTSSDFTVDFWYPDYETAWILAGCLNTIPLPYNNINDLPNYPTQLECCKGAYAGQMSGACLSQLESPPTTSPTNTGNTGSLFYPDYSTAWPEAGCVNVLPVPSGRPTYTSHVACCKGSYGGQITGVCLSQLDSPPTTSPTSSGGLDVYYPDYKTAWEKAACVNTRPMPSGRPVYSTMLACCKGAYAGQMSGYCLSQLEAPPTTSPTTSDATADFWYPDYDTAWRDARCLNSLPLPFLPGRRPTYTTNKACCSAAYGGQVSKACICSMESPPAGCPTPPPTPVPTMHPFTVDPELNPSLPPTLFPTLEPTTPEPTLFQTIIPTRFPTTKPMMEPSLQPTEMPTGVTNSPPPVSTMHPFATNLELRAAIQEYLSQGCPSDANCQATSTYGGAIGDWDVSRVPDFSKLFLDDSYDPVPGADSFNEPINWDTGSATQMSGMFASATAFNQPLSFNTAKVEKMAYMFHRAYAFNQDLSAFDTAKVNNTDGMFGMALAFNQPISFNTGMVETMAYMFWSAAAFNQPLSAFDTANVEIMAYMFMNATAFNQPLSFNTGKVNNMEGMFYNATAFNQDLCHFGDNFSQLQDVTAMFNDTDCADTYNPTSATGPWCAVTSCPAEENNQNIDTPTISPMPTTGTPSTASPSTTAPSTTAPTAPEDEVIYSQNFDYPLNGVFPDDYDDAMDGLSLGWMTGGGLAPLDSDTLPGARRRLHRQLTEEGFRRLQDDTNDINPYFDWMISTEESLSLPNSISPPNLMNSAINVNMTRAVSYAMFVTGEDWGQGELSFDFWTDANPDDEFHEIEIFWTDDLDGGSLNFDTDLRNTGGVWDDHGLILPEGRHYVIISYVFNPTEADDLMPPEGYMGSLYIDDVKYTQFGTPMPTLSPSVPVPSEP